MEKFQSFFLLVTFSVPMVINAFAANASGQINEPPNQVVDPETGNTIIYTNPFEISFYVDLRRGTATFPNRDYSEEIELSIDMRNQQLEQFLFDKKLQDFMDVAPSQVAEILSYRDKTIDEFASIIEGVRSSDDPRFPAVKRRVEALSQKMLNECESVFLPHQRKLRDSYNLHLAIWAEGGGINSVLGGAIWSTLDEKSQKSVLAKRKEMAEMVKQELIALERRVLEELLAEVEPEALKKVNAMLENPPRFANWPFLSAHRPDSFSSIGVYSFSKLFNEGINGSNRFPCEGCDD